MQITSSPTFCPAPWTSLNIDQAGAVSVYQQLVSDERAPVSAWFNLGYLQQELGHLSEAESSFRRALALNPKLDQAWYGLGLVLIEQGRLEDATEALEQNTKLQPMSPYAWYQLARVHLDRGAPEAAKKIIQHLKGFEPKFAAQLERETGLSG